MMRQKAAARPVDGPGVSPRVAALWGDTCSPFSFLQAQLRDLCRHLAPGAWGRSFSSVCVCLRAEALGTPGKEVGASCL